MARYKKRTNSKLLEDISKELEQNADRRNPGGSPHLTENLEENLTLIKKASGQNPDFVIRRFTVNAAAGPVNAAVLFTDGMVDSDLIANCILKPTLEKMSQMAVPVVTGTTLSVTVAQSIVTIPDVKIVGSLPTIVADIVRGDTIMLFDGDSSGLSCSTRGYESRNIEEPTLETVVRGPKEGFTENIKTNLTLLRRRIPNPNLRFIQLYIGKYSQTRVIVLHIDGVTEKDLVDEVKNVSPESK